MKKIAIAVVAAAMMMLTTIVSAETDIKIMINGEELICSPSAFLDDNRLLVPMRAIFEELDAVVDWDQEMQTVTANKNEFFLMMQINNQNMFLNSTKIQLEVAPMLVEERTMVPLRAVSEAFNIPVEWNEDTREVIINF